MNNIEFMAELDDRYFARCVWVEEDLDDLEGIEELSEDQRCELMDKAKSNMEDRMVEIGWEVLQYELDQILGR